MTVRVALGSYVTSIPNRSCAVTLALLFGCGLCGGSEGTGLPGPGTRRMAERLEEIRRAADPRVNQFMNAERVAMLRGAVAPEPRNMEEINLQLLLGAEQLRSGLSQEALEKFHWLGRTMAQQGTTLHPESVHSLMTFVGLANMRIGEQTNCLLSHSIDACLLPIRGGGVHKDPMGSQAAVQVLTQILSRHPDDLQARWLLNIAHMTLGDYPEKIPSSLLIPPRVFESEYPLGRFTNIAPTLRLDVDGLAGGVIADDFDGDGLLDLMMSSMGLQDQLRYFRNNGDGTFSDRTTAAGLTGEVGGLNLIQADYNNDGHRDVLVLRGGWMAEGGVYPNSLLRNNGDGTFEDVTEAAGVLSFNPTQTAVWFDYNGDGWLDLFVGNEDTGVKRRPCELYRNNKDGTFTECAAGAGLAHSAFVKAVVSADYNNDGQPDLYVSIRNAANLLFRNDGPEGGDLTGRSGWRFTEVAAAAGVQEPVHSFPAWFFDYDNDGWQDLFVTGYQISGVEDIVAEYLGQPGKGTRAKLYRNKRDGTFQDVTEEAGLNRVLHAMGANFGDLDNDGWLDFYVGTGDPEFTTLIPNRMFRNADGKRFQDVTTAGGFGHLQKGHGIAFADFDNDGDQDVYEDLGGAYSGDRYGNALFENPGFGNRWIVLDLEGTRANRSAIGTRVKLTVKTAEGERTIHRTVGSGGSFGASPLRQQIGLGRAESIVAVEVTWPGSGVKERLSGLGLDAVYRIREGDGRAVVRAVKRFRFPPVDDPFCAPVAQAAVR